MQRGCSGLISPMLFKQFTVSKTIIWKHWVAFVLPVEVDSFKIKGCDAKVGDHLGFRSPCLGRNYLLASVTF